MTQPANRRLVTEDRFLVTEAEAAAAYDAVNSIASLSPNYIINGAFEINQRSFTSTTASGYVLYDRWTCYQQGGGTTTFSAQNFTPGAAPSAAIEGTSFLRAVTTGYSAASSLSNFTNKIEDVRTLAGKTVTASFWAKASSGTPKVSVEFNQYFGTGGSGYVQANAGFVTLSTSWTRYSVTVTIPGISGKTIGDGNYISLDFWMTAGSDFASRANSIGAQNNTFDFWGVQLEAGSVATAFRRNANSIQGELAACQRYYWRTSAAAGIAFSDLGFVGKATSTTSITGLFPLANPLRTKPTGIDFSNLSWISLWGGTTTAISNAGISQYCSQSAMLVNFTTTGTTTGTTYMIMDNGTAASYIGLSAEL